ncbi:MAG: AmpG family muropeptide MFS transporter [Alphaproteobacteria bacterium]
MTSPAAYVLPNRWVDRLGATAVYAERRVALFFLFGFSSGLPLALSFGTLSYWLTQVGTSKGEIGLFALLTVPYAFKFVWAPFIDRLPFPVLTRLLGRRRGWMLAMQIGLILSIGFVGFCDPVPGNLLPVALGALAIAFFSASQDIVIDAHRVELLDLEQQGAGAGAYQIGYRIAMLVSGGGALIIAGLGASGADSVGNWEAAYSVMAVLMLVGVLAVLLSPEPAQQDSDDAQVRRQQAEAYLKSRPRLQGFLGEVLAWLYVSAVAPFLEFMQKSGWFVILAFVLFYKFGDTLASMMTGPFYLEHGFSLEAVGLISKPVGITATIFGAVLAGVMVYRLGIIKSLWICGIAQLVSNFMFVILASVGPDPWMLGFTVAIENFAGGMGATAFMAYMASLCNVAYTATQYALLTSLMSVGRTLFSAPSGFLAEAVSWPVFFSLTVVAAVPGLVLLWWVTRRFSEDAERADNRS